jgi:hypothetical protein
MTEAVEALREILRVPTVSTRDAEARDHAALDTVLRERGGSGLWRGC